MTEKEFVEEFIKSVNPKLNSQEYSLTKAKNLFYELTVNKGLKLRVSDISKPIRGQSSFQTDLILFEIRGKINFPLVVFEFKINPSTHDIIVYSAKARKHKQIYPWLRYGMLICKTDNIPIEKFLKHNEFLDFCVSVKNILNDDNTQNNYEIERISEFIESEIKNAQRLEKIHFKKGKEPNTVYYYQKMIELKERANDE